MQTPPALIRRYRAIVSPLGRRRVDRWVARGEIPASLGGPLRFLVGDRGMLDGPVREVVRTVETIRAELAARTGPLSVVHPGFDAPDPRRTPAAVAYTSSVSEEWGTFLHLLGRATGARRVLELGGCAGISGCYLATVPSCERFVTVEGSGDLAAVAAANLARVSPAARVVNALFDDALDGVLASFPDGIDLAFVDGQKDGDRMLPIVGRVAERLAPGGLLVLDDIRWSSGMAALWRAVAGSRGLSHALDVGRFGIAVRDAASERPRPLGLAAYTGWLRRAHRRG